MVVDGRGVSSQTFEHTFDSVEMSTKEWTPAPAETGRGHGRTSKEFDMDDVTRQDIARDYLTRARADLERAALQRIRYILLGRQYGLTNAAIGECLGITEAAVRTLVARHGAVER